MINFAVPSGTELSTVESSDKNSKQFRVCSVLRYERKTPGCTNGKLRANLGANAERAYVLTPTGNFSIEKMYNGLYRSYNTLRLSRESVNTTNPYKHVNKWGHMKLNKVYVE